MQLVASMGLTSFDDLGPHLLRRRVNHGEIASYADLVEHLTPGQLLVDPPDSWAQDWRAADPDTFRS